MLRAFARDLWDTKGSFALAWFCLTCHNLIRTSSLRALSFSRIRCPEYLTTGPVLCGKSDIRQTVVNRQMPPTRPLSVIEQLKPDAGSERACSSLTQPHHLPLLYLSDTAPRHSNISTPLRSTACNITPPPFPLLLSTAQHDNRR